MMPPQDSCYQELFPELPWRGGSPLKSLVILPRGGSSLEWVLKQEGDHKEAVSEDGKEDLGQSATRQFCR